MSAPLLEYVATTVPYPLEASPGRGDPLSCTLTILAANPTPDQAVTIEGVQVTLPLGSGASELTLTAPPAAQVSPPEGWELQPGSGGGVYALVPASGSVQVTGQALEFAFNDVAVNSVPGPVAGLIVAEGSGGCQPPDCPTTQLAVTKYPTGWGEITFSISDPDPSQGEAVTVTWSGPPGARYTIEYPFGGETVRVPDADQRPLGNVGQYPADGAPPLVLTAQTTFTLEVAETIDGNPYSLQMQKTATPTEPPPQITEFSGTVSYDDSGSCTLTFHWQAENVAHCLLTGAGGEQLDASSPPEGHPVTLDAPPDSVFTLTAVGTTSVDSSLVLEWGLASTIPLAGSTHPICVALAPDGSRLYAATGDTLTAYDVPALPAQAPQQLYTASSRYPFCALAVSRDTTGAWLVWAAVLDGTNVRIQPLLETSWTGSEYTWMPGQESVQSSGSPTSGVRMALAPSGDTLYATNWTDRTCTVFGVDTARRSATSAVDVQVDDNPSGLAVAADGTVYVSQLESTVVLTPSTSDPQAPLTRTGEYDTWSTLPGPLNGWIDPWQSDLALAGDCVFIGFGNESQPPTLVDVLDRQTLQLRQPNAIAAAADSMAVAPDGLRIYAVDAAATSIAVVAPAALSAP